MGRVWGDFFKRSKTLIREQVAKELLEKRDVIDNRFSRLNTDKLPKMYIITYDDGTARICAKERPVPSLSGQFKNTWEAKTAIIEWYNEHAEQSSIIRIGYGPGDE